MSRNLEVLNNWIREVGQRWEEIPDLRVDPEKLSHLAIICDGNRRSAKERSLAPYFGHQVGVEVIKGVLRACQKWGIQDVTFWVWSTENWQRKPDQVDFAMSLASTNLSDKKMVAELISNQVRFTHFGRRDRFPIEMADQLVNLERLTCRFNKHRFNLALDYGGLDEMTYAAIRIHEDIQTGKITPELLRQQPELIYSYLYTSEHSNPDLVIRSGMKKNELPRTSGFMPIQTAYSSWVFVDENFPDLKPITLLESIQKHLEYQHRMGK